MSNSQYLEEIRNYFMQYKDSFSRENLRAKLIESGYQAYDVDQVIFQVYNESSKNVMPESFVQSGNNNPVGVNFKSAGNLYDKNEKDDLLYEYSVKFIPLKAALEALVPSVFLGVIILTQGSFLFGLAVFVVIFLILFLGSYFSYLKGKKVNYKIFRTGITVTYGGLGLKVNEHYKWTQFDKYKVNYYFLPKLLGLDMGKITFYRYEDKATKGLLGAIGKFTQDKVQERESGSEAKKGLADLVGSMYQGYSQGAVQDRVDQSTTVTTQVGESGEESGSFLSRIFGSFWGQSSKKYIHPSSTRSIGGRTETSINQNVLYVNEMPNITQNLSQIEQYLGLEKRI